MNLDQDVDLFVQEISARYVDIKKLFFHFQMKMSCKSRFYIFYLVITASFKLQINLFMILYLCELEN